METHTQISPLAFVDPSAQIGEGTVVQPFAYIDKNVIIGENCVIMAHSTILEGVEIGNDNLIYQNAVIGSTPQSFRYQKGHLTHVRIGNKNRIRENVVIAGSLDENTATTIGDDNFLMDGVHVCHDVKIGNHCVIGIHSQIAGECEISDYSILSGSVILQHLAKVGVYSLIQSGCRVHYDVPPYIIAGGNPTTYRGVNVDVLKKYDNLDDRILRHITNTYRLIYMSDTSLEDVLHQIYDQIPRSEEIEQIVDFIKQSRLGIIRRQKDS
ncbi:MAG: acyl-ACP--UDP-N-acetylglucosamine O-acyltransferase [Alloprevotella sp.]|nr:acyl-ACP--UDP-N-acetylglucosamine O-acyltransferase [Alloprevotella sp.]